MMALALYSEPYRPEGNIDALAARRAIGRPHLDFWTLFLRETLQNSWDARLSNDRPIGFTVDAFWPSAAKIAVLRDEVFAARPPQHAVAKFLRGNELPMLVVTDHGTRGLEGPTRADIATTEHTDFVDFARNIGRAEDKAVGGGTYGFGKGVLYDASTCTTVLIFTRTHLQGRPVSRLMGIGQGSSFESGGKMFTGRHWWGVADDLTGAEPLTGDAAEGLAAAIGMTGIPEGDTGTSIMVVGPVADTDTETLRSIVERIAEAALWWAWPHMLATEGGPTIDFNFTYEGEEIAVGNPTVHPVLKHYATAYERASKLLAAKASQPSWPWTDVEVRSERPARRLGGLSYRKLPREQLAGAGHTSYQPDAASHVALMRDPRMVVRYMEVTADPQGQATIGVFRADPELDLEFAKSEPVAHDDWAPENLRLDKYERNPVKQTLEKLRKEFRQAPSSVANPDGTERFEGITRLATAMGSLLDGQPGGTDPRGGANAPTKSVALESDAPSDQAKDAAAARHRRSPAHASLVGRPRLALLDGRTVVQFPVLITVPAGSGGLRVHAEPRVVLEGGSAEAVGEEPLGGDAPELVGWGLTAAADPSAQELSRQAELVITTIGEHQVSAWVRPPPDTAITLHLHTAAVEP